MEVSELTVAKIITQTISTLISNIFGSIDNSLYSILDDLVFINSDIMKNPNLINIVGEDRSSGLVMIANALIIGFLIYYAFSYLVSHFTFSKVQSPGQVIFRLLLCIICINFSYFLCSQLILLISSTSLAIRGIGESIFDHEICFSSLLNQLNSIIYFNEFSTNFFSLDGIIKAIMSIGLLNLALSYALRYVMVLVFVLISPFAFLSLILDSTSFIFKSWFKIFLSLLLLQILIPLILLVSFSFDYYEGDITQKLIYIGSIYALIKANSYVRDFMGGLSTEINIGISNMKSTISGG